MTVWFATVTVPVRELLSGAPEAVKPKVPEPVADAPLVTVIHEAFETPVHAHVLPAETATEPVPPAAPTVTEVEDSVNVQEGEGLDGFELQPDSRTTHTTIRTHVRMAVLPLSAAPSCLPA